MGIGRGWRKRWRRVWGGRTRGLGRRVASRARGLMGVGWVLVVVDTAVLSSLEASTWTSSHSSLRDMHGTHSALLYRADVRGHIQEGSGRATRSGRVLDCRARDLPCSPLCLLSHDLTPVSLVLRGFVQEPSPTEIISSKFQIFTQATTARNEAVGGLLHSLLSDGGIIYIPPFLVCKRWEGLLQCCH